MSRNKFHLAFSSPLPAERDSRGEDQGEGDKSGTYFGTNPYAIAPSTWLVPVRISHDSPLPNSGFFRYKWFTERHIDRFRRLICDTHRTKKSETEVNEYAIRKATVADIEWLVDFNCRIARETEDKALDRQRVTRGVTRGLQQGGEVTYFVAETNTAADGPQLIGCLMLTREWSDWRDGWLVWIQSVYVVAEHRGAGVFRSLLDYATQFVQADKDVVGLRLYVEAENVRAQSVYQRTGFKDPNYKVLEKLF